MKQTTVVLLLLLFQIGRSQVISGTVLDSVSKQPLEFATVFSTENEHTTFTDGDGKFKIKFPNPNARLIVSYVGYESKTILASLLKLADPFEIYLKPQSEQLSEITLKSQTKQYSGNKSITPDANGKTQFLSFQFGTENCTYVRNPYNKCGKIQSVALDLKKMASHAKDCPKCEVDYLTSYNLQFYEYDSIAKEPGRALHAKPIVVAPENRNYRLVIDVGSLSVPFPKNGVCIGVEFLNIKYENPKRAGAYIAPLMQFAESRDMHPIIAWRRYRAEGWHFVSTIGADAKGRKYDFMTVDVVVKTEK